MIADPMPNPRSSAKNRVAVLENSSNCSYQPLKEKEKFEVDDARDSGVGLGLSDAIRFPMSEESG